MPLPPNEIYAQYPVGIQMVLLMYYKNPSGDFLRDVIPYTAQANVIEDIVVNRNLSGKSFETDGRIDEAIRLYELNIGDLVDTPHPYERLRIIYTKQKRFDDAIRACQAYIEMSKQLSDAILKELGDAELAKQMAGAGNFPIYIQKIKRIQNRDDNGFVIDAAPPNRKGK